MNAKDIHYFLIKECDLRSSETRTLPDFLISELMQNFMPVGIKNCRKDSCEMTNCQSRCGYQYWYEHGRITKQLMEKLAFKIGENEELYGMVGFIHDIDYLSHPHDRGNKIGSHPIPLVGKLIENHIHPEICLAILEHAPYLRLENKNRCTLSRSLTACEELATLLSIKDNAEYYALLSQDAKELAETLNEIPKYLIDTDVDIKPRVTASPQKFINLPLGIVLGKILQ